MSISTSFTESIEMRSPPTLAFSARQEEPTAVHWTPFPERNQALQVFLNSLMTSRKAARSKLEAIKHFNFTAILGRVAKENPSWSTERLETALSEYQKWMSMCAIMPGVKLGMCSQDVDEVWHAHILYTRDYACFCESVAGRFIHHQPTSDEEMEQGDITSSVNTRILLKFCFGKLSEVWQGAECDEKCRKCHNCECQCNTSGCS